MKKRVKDITDVSDLTPDPQNANVGTERGRKMLAESLAKCGAGRSILVDRDGVVIAGNKTLEAAKAAGLPLRVVQTDGHRLVVVVRKDLDLDTAEDLRARELAYYDNRVNEVGLAWDATRIQSDMLAGIDVSVAFLPEELAAVGTAIEEHAAKVAAMPTDTPDDVLAATAAEDAPVTVDFRERVIIEFSAAGHAERWARFIERIRARFAGRDAAEAVDLYLREWMQ